MGSIASSQESVWPPPPTRHKVTSTQDGGAHHLVQTQLHHLVQTQLQPDGILSVGSTSKLTLTLRAPTKHDIKSAGKIWTPTIHPFSNVSTRQEGASLLAREITSDREEFRTTTRIEDTNLSVHSGSSRSSCYRWGSTRKGKYRLHTCRAVTDSPSIGVRKLHSHSLSLLQDSCSGRASSPNPSDVCQQTRRPGRECLRMILICSASGCGHWCLQRCQVGLDHFRKERKPEGTLGVKRCLECPENIEARCEYSAKKSASSSARLCFTFLGD